MGQVEPLNTNPCIRNCSSMINQNEIRQVIIQFKMVSHSKNVQMSKFFIRVFLIYYIIYYYYYYKLCSQIEVPEHSTCRLVPH